MTSSFVTMSTPFIGRTRAGLMNLSPLVLGDRGEGAPAREPAVEGVIVAHLGLPALPAEEREAPLDVGVEVDEPLLVVLEDGTEDMDPLDVFLQEPLEIVPLLNEPHVRRPLGEFRVVDPPAPVLLHVLRELQDLPEGNRPVPHLAGDRLE